MLLVPLCRHVLLVGLMGLVGAACGAGLRLGAGGRSQVCRPASGTGGQQVARGRRAHQMRRVDLGPWWRFFSWP